jgi:ATP-binding cassette subfamily B protein
MRRHAWLYAAAILGMGLASLMRYGVPLVMKVTVDSVLKGSDTAGDSWPGRLFSALLVRDDTLRSLQLAAAAVLGLTVLSGLFGFLRDRWAAIASEAAVRRLRERLYDRLQRARCDFHDRMDTGDLVQRCTSDVDTVHLFLTRQVVEVGQAFVLILVVLPLMIGLSVPMTVVSMLLVPVIIVFSIVFFTRIGGAFQVSDEAEGRMTARLQENLTGARVVKAFARQDFERARFGRKNADFRDKEYRLIRLLSIYWSGSDLLCFAQRGLVLFVGGFWALRGELQVGTLIAFFAYADMFLWPVRRMGRTLTDLGKALVSLGRLKDILDEPPEPAAQHAPDLEVAGRITFADVHFAHGRLDVLRGVSFEAEPGRTLAIMGPSGAGKSTVINLLLRLYDYDRGCIRLDGRELRELDRRAVRRRIGAVLQEPFLYSKTLRDNIRLGQHGATDREVTAAARAANVHESIERFEHGYDTLVGERGVTLSGGQRQRVALARAILRDPPILVLDDALSAVDTRTERMILDALKSRRGRHTTLVITHRMSTAAQADRVIVLEHGRVVQHGRPEELVKVDGPYRRLWEIQTSLQTDLREDLAAPAGREAER